MLWYGKIYNSCHFLFVTCRLLDDISVVLTNHPNTKQSLQCHLQLCVQVFRGSLRYIEQDMCNYLNVTHTNMYTYLVQVYAIMMIMFVHIYCLLCPLNMLMAINRQDHVVFFYWVKFSLNLCEILTLNLHCLRLLNCASVLIQYCGIHKENPTRCNNVSTFYYSIFIWSSTCFGRHTAHHQEPKNALAASGFSYVEGCWTCSWWTLSSLTTSTNYTSNNLPRMKNQRLPE
jgi:hypothetical protein